LMGLYLATPFLRVLVSHLDRNKFKYLIILWFVGNITVPFINQFAPFGFNPVMFVFTGWVGYYLLGAYLVKTKVAPWKAVIGVVMGLLTTMVGAWWITAIVGQSRTNYFHEPLNTTIILASTSMFLLLTALPKNKIENGNTKIKALLHWISQNTLPIYLFHIIIMQTIERGYLGFTLNASTISPIIEIPLLTLITFATSAAIIYPLKKIPYLKYLLG
jgi:surface polysaccharide O-acyltransferase-like enzyme